MRTGKCIITSMVVLVILSFMISGCAVNFYKQSPRGKQKIAELQDRVDELEEERKREQEKFEEVKRMLERKLKDQIADDQVSLKMSDGGIVIVLSDNILFDSGKAELKEKAFPVLDKVSKVIVREVPDKNIGISGHTDNIPITYSNWKSNWELSSARATSVLYYLEDQGIPSKKLSATGYGEHRPIASNDTQVGRSRNRRVEIVILPEFAEERPSEEGNVQVK